MNEERTKLNQSTCSLCHGWGELEGYAGVYKMKCFICEGTGYYKACPCANDEDAHCRVCKKIVGSDSYCPNCDAAGENMYGND